MALVSFRIGKFPFPFVLESFVFGVQPTTADCLLTFCNCSHPLQITGAHECPEKTDADGDVVLIQLCLVSGGQDPDSWTCLPPSEEGGKLLHCC